MPPAPIMILLVVVIAAAALTVWLLSIGGSSLLAFAVPATLIAAVAVRKLGK